VNPPSGTPSCGTAITLPVSIAPLTFNIASAINTTLSTSPTKGTLVVTITGGSPNLPITDPVTGFTYTLTGPGTDAPLSPLLVLWGVQLR
jgi:hypothetical protein